jgi:hypothetical protein
MCKKWSSPDMTNKEYEELMKKLRHDRQMQKKRLYEQAKRAAGVDKDRRR